MSEAKTVVPVRPTKEQVEKFKEEYPYSEFRGYPHGTKFYFVYRSYTLNEQEQMMREREKFNTENGRDLNDEEMEDALLSRCVVWPTNFMELKKEGNLPGAIPSTLANNILVISGFVAVEPEVL